MEPANDGIELAAYIDYFTVNDLPDDFSINNNGVIVVDEINVGNGQYFESIAAAIDAINAMDDSDKSYTINIVSNLDEPQCIGGEIKASEITLQGERTTNGDVTTLTTIDGGWRFVDNKWEYPGNPDAVPLSTLVISANVPVKIKDLKITGGSQESGGGIILGDGSIVTAEGILVTGNGSLSTSSYGGGVCVWGSSKFTMISGEISGNMARNGSGVYVDTNCEFTMSGDARVNTNNDVYVNAKNSTQAQITIGGTFTGTDIVATITPADYNKALEDPVLSGESELVKSERGRFAVTPSRIEQTGELKNWRILANGKLQEMTGAKAAPDAVGDIVFSDGSAMPYSEELTLSDNQKSAAVAVIFDTQNKKGVALQQTNNDQRVQWCIDNKVKGYGFVDGAVSTTDGKANTEAIYALDDFGDGTNYPPFKYAREYSAGGYTDWYIPATDELNSIWNNITVINAALEKVGATIISSSNATPARGYWSSTQVTGNGNNGSAYGKHFFYPNGTGSATSAESKASSDAKLQVRCVRIFDKEFIGAKKPGSELGVGDIVFSDGSATAYVEGLTLDEKQKAAAVAVIFYVGTENDALGKRTLGIGKYNSTSDGNNTTYAWAVDGAMGSNPSQMQAFNDILSHLVYEEPASGQYATFNGEYLTGDLDGSDNWGKVKEIDKNYMGKYPGFEWVDEYANSYNLPDDYKDGWFMPSAAELYTLWMNMFGYDNNKLINTILTAIGGTTLKDQDDDYVYSYLTSNRTYENEDGYEYISLTIGFDEGATCSQGLYTVTGYVCAIREF